MLTPRWTKLFQHLIQWKFWRSKKRFIVVPAGRRSGKSEFAKRKLIKRALLSKQADAHFFFAAPTYRQAKNIYWEDLKRMIPPKFMERLPSESDLTVYLAGGKRISVVGMDKPYRIEGQPIDGIVMDEYAQMKEAAWTISVRPGLSTVGREGWAIFIGTPRGRNHFYDLYKRAQAELSEKRIKSDWIHFTWTSEDILAPEEIESAKRDLDELTYNQEYRASFVNFAGRAYYPFEESTHVRSIRPLYDPLKPLVVCFDFNTAPGTAVIVQEIPDPSGRPTATKAVRNITGCLDEVFIRRNSNTPMVCEKVLADWGEHQGQVFVYGDSTGGANRTSAVEGPDWELIDNIFGPHFGNRYYNQVTANPLERARVNSMNSRLKGFDGTISLLVDPTCRHLIEDFEGVSVVEGSNGKLEKEDGDPLTHLSDGLGYYVHEEFPVESGGLTVYR